ncbi:hypothetical protein IB49_17165 [Geobacillus sp. LC300]|nr:hypothetical protein IB49_17165 [Geobacillus sp. LC300]
MYAISFKFGTVRYSRDERAQYIAKLESLKSFLEGLQVYNTRAKLTNLKYDVPEIEQQKENLAIVEQLEQLEQKINECMKIVNYLSTALHIMKTNKNWAETSISR